MKTNIFALCASAIVMVSGTAHAYVTPDVVTLDAVTDQDPAIPGYQLHFGSRPASIYVNFEGGTMNYVTQTLDVVNDFKLAQLGDEITAQTFAHGVSAADNPYGNPLAGSDFYLAGMVQTGFLDPGETFTTVDAVNDFPHATRFGWAHIVIQGNGVATVTDSAIAYSEQGIIVGTTLAVPEPSSLALSVLGLIGLATMRKTRPG